MCIRDSHIAGNRAGHRGRAGAAGECPGAACFRRVNLCARCLLYTSDAADERSSVDLGGRRIIKKNNNTHVRGTVDTM